MQPGPGVPERRPWAESSPKDTPMLNLVLALLPKPSTDHDEGLLAKLVLWGQRKIKYRRALNELHRLDDRDLDDLDLARADFPAFAWRHAVGLPPLARPSH